MSINSNPILVKSLLLTLLGCASMGVDGEDAKTVGGREYVNTSE